MKKKLLAMALCLAMVISLLPMSALALGLAVDSTIVDTDSNIGTIVELDDTSLVGLIDTGVAETNDTDDTNDLTAAVSLSLKVSATATYTITAEEELEYSASGYVYDDEGNKIASYTVSEDVEEIVTYKTETVTTTTTTVSTSAASSITSGSTYVIGTTGSYLTVSSDGTLSYSSELTDNAVWTVVSRTSGNTTYYNLYNETTGYYLYISGSGSGNNITYSLTTGTSNSTTYGWRYNSSYGFYYQGSSSGRTTYYYLRSSSATLSNTTSTSTLSSNSAKVYAVTTTTTTVEQETDEVESAYWSYTYIITFTGLTEGEGSVTLCGITYNLSVVEEKLNESSYVWHIANIETITSAESSVITDSSEYTFAVAASIQAMEAMTSDDVSDSTALADITNGAVYVQYLTSSGNSSTKTPLGVEVSGYDADVYYSTYDASTGTYSGVNVTVYGSNKSGTGTGGTDLSMAEVTLNTDTDDDQYGTYTVTQSVAVSSSVTVSMVATNYDTATIYDYDYITIVPEDGYYVSAVVLACNGCVGAKAGSPYVNVGSADSVYGYAFTNELGHADFFGGYGVGCTTMASIEDASTSITFDPTNGTSVEINMASLIAAHDDADADVAGYTTPYVLLIELAEIPTPLYVEYEAGTAADYLDNATIVTTTDYDTYATSGTSIAYQFNEQDLKSLTTNPFQYDVLDPITTSYVDADGETWYFAGWEVTYYSTATGTYVDSDGNVLASDASDAANQYPTLTGSAGVASSAINYGTNTTLYLYTHVKLVAQWTTEKPATINYVVDFGLPVELTIIESLIAQGDLDSNYSWSLNYISEYPSYGTASLDKTTGSITYTMSSVMSAATSMTVALTGSQSNTAIATKLVNINIYPATTVYYEEGFATYGTGTSVTTGGSWSGTSAKGRSTQQTQITLDTATNGTVNATYYNYGYDSAYATTTGASNNSQAVTTTAKDSLTFTFTGTGVDIYANCTATTGIVSIKITNESGKTVKLLTVNTANVGDYAADGTSYNTPIASVTGLEHGTYSVLIYVMSTTLYEDQTNEFCFDGFRVYDTVAQVTASADEAYLETSAEYIQSVIYACDAEDYPTYIEVRDAVLTYLDVESTEDYDSSVAGGQVFSSVSGGIALVNASGTEYSVEDVLALLTDGAKNEIYLPAGTTLVLKLQGSALLTEDENDSPREIQVGVKTTSGTGTVMLGDEEYTVSTVDMFYSASVDIGEDDTTWLVTITNSGDTPISITKLKACGGEVELADEAITVSEIISLFLQVRVDGVVELSTESPFVDAIIIDPPIVTPILKVSDDK